MVQTKISIIFTLRTEVGRWGQDRLGGSTKINTYGRSCISLFNTNCCFTSDELSNECFETYDDTLRVIYAISSSWKQLWIWRCNKKEKQTVFSFSIGKKRGRSMTVLFHQILFRPVQESVQWYVQNAFVYWKRSPWPFTYHLNISTRSFQLFLQHLACEEC